MPMEPKTQAGLLDLLEGAARHLQPRITPQEWRQAYDDFCLHLEQITSNPSIIPVMRSVEHLRIDLASLHTALSHEAEEAALCFATKLSKPSIRNFGCSICVCAIRSLRTGRRSFRSYISIRNTR